MNIDKFKLDIKSFYLSPDKYFKNKNFLIKLNNALININNYLITQLSITQDINSIQYLKKIKIKKYQSINYNNFFLELSNPNANNELITNIKNLIEKFILIRKKLKSNYKKSELKSTIISVHNAPTLVLTPVALDTSDVPEVQSVSILRNIALLSNPDIVLTPIPTATPLQSQTPELQSQTPEELEGILLMKIEQLGIVPEITNFKDLSNTVTLIIKMVYQVEKYSEPPSYKSIYDTIINIVTFNHEAIQSMLKAVNKINLNTLKTTNYIDENQFILNHFKFNTEVQVEIFKLDNLPNIGEHKDNILFSTYFHNAVYNLYLHYREQIQQLEFIASLNNRSDFIYEYMQLLYNTINQLIKNIGYALYVIEFVHNTIINASKISINIDPQKKAEYIVKLEEFKQLLNFIITSSNSASLFLEYIQKIIDIFNIFNLYNSYNGDPKIDTNYFISLYIKYKQLIQTNNDYVKKAIVQVGHIITHAQIEVNSIVDDTIRAEFHKELIEINSYIQSYTLEAPQTLTTIAPAAPVPTQPPLLPPAAPLTLVAPPALAVAQETLFKLEPIEVGRPSDELISQLTTLNDDQLTQLT